MNGIGLDCGNATLKLVLLSPEGKFLWEKTASHYGAVVQSARRLLGELLAADPGACGCPVVITGNASDRLKAGCNALAVLGEIPAIHLGVRLLAPEARSAIEIGSQSARFLTGLDQNTPPRFAVNEHCAGGTGSFFEDQMSRLGLKLEDYSRLVGQARSIPRLSGRCAVFAKTDIIHRQQEGVPTPDILLGLCYAMVRNYKAVIVRGLPVEKPVALCGGIGHNQGVLQAVREVFGLTEAELILPEKFPYAGARRPRRQPWRPPPALWGNCWPVYAAERWKVGTICAVSRRCAYFPVHFRLSPRPPVPSRRMGVSWGLMWAPPARIWCLPAGTVR